MFGLLQLVLHGLAVDGSQMMFASTINVQQIDEVLPTLIERLQIVGNLFAGRELLIVRINLVLHPAEILDRLAFARVKSFDDRFALGITQLAGALGFAPRDQAPVKRSCGNHSEIQSLSRERRQQRRHVLNVGSRDGEAGHPPKVDRLLKCFFQIPKIYPGQFHVSYDECLLIVLATSVWSTVFRRPALMITAWRRGSQPSPGAIYCLGVVSPCAGSACGEDSLDAAGSRPISRLYSSNLSCNCMSIASRSISCICVSTDAVPSCILASAAAARRSILSRISSKVEASSPSWNEAIVWASCSCSFACFDSLMSCIASAVRFCICRT